MRKSKLLNCLFVLPLLFSCGSKYSYEVDPYMSLGMLDKNGEYISLLNTVVTLQMYNENELKNIKNDYDRLLKKAHGLFDAYHSYYNYVGLNEVNQSYGTNEEIVIDSYLYDIISKAIDLTILSDGIFNLTMGEVIDVWKEKFDSSLTSNNLPEQERLNDALNSVVDPSSLKDTIILNEDNTSIKLSTYNTKYTINLGALCKGYALDMVSYLFDEDQPAIINAGTSSIAFKGKYRLSNRDYYIVNLREPKTEAQTIQAVAQIKCEAYTNISSSGDYEKFFYATDDNNKLYHHILDANTGYSNSYHASVTVTSKCDSYVLDCLSTVLMNIEDMTQIENMVNRFETYTNENIDYMVVNRDNNKYEVYVNEGFNNNILEINNNLISKKIIV
jgi:thiamine biosynthesis lipoprotein